MMSTTTPDKVETETVPSDGAAKDQAAVPAGPGPLPTPGRTQLVDEAAQEEAAEERAEGGGYN
jgi:hypothetical protein